MLSKFASVVRTKTIEFFAEEEEEEEEENDAASVISAPEEVITGQRVVVLKPDPLPARPGPDAVASSVLAAVASFHAAYLQLQAAHSPFDPDAVSAADRAAVSHLQRISDLKRQYYNPNPNPNPNFSSISNSCYQNPGFWEAQVQENQTLLRTFETVFNRLQADIDRKDAETTALKQRLKESEAVNSKLARKLKSNCLPAVDKVEPLLSVGLFESVVKDCFRSMHRFSKLVIRLTNKSGWDFDSGVNLIYPDVCYAKPGHKRYAILSYICLGMFDGFDSDAFCSEKCEFDLNLSDGSDQRRNSLRQFIQHLAVDPLESVRTNPDCGFDKFCKSRYVQLISKCMESSIFGNLDSSLGSLVPANPLYQLFVDMASSLWSLHKLAHAYDPVVEIFQVERGTEFSMVFMENIVRSADYGRAIPAKVGFTVVPGFRVGKTAIQCRVYLDGVKEAL